MLSRLPDFLIVGAPKAATTSLYGFLSQHPEVCLSEIKEPEYFSLLGEKRVYFSDTRLGKQEKIIHSKEMSLEKYCHLFKDKEKILGEASTTYLYLHERTIPRVVDLYLKQNAALPKIIISLRDPIDRAWSHYWQHRRDGVETLSFEEVIQESVISNRLRNGYWFGYDYIGMSKYYEPVKHYCEVFPEVCVLFDMEKKAVRENGGLDQLTDFLGISRQAKLCDVPHENISGVPNSKFIEVFFSYGLTVARKIASPVVFPASSAVGKNLRSVKNKIVSRLAIKPEMSCEIKGSLATLFQQDIVFLEDEFGKDILWTGRRNEG